MSVVIEKVHDGHTKYKKRKSRGRVLIFVGIGLFMTAAILSIFVSTKIRRTPSSQTILVDPHTSLVSSSPESKVLDGFTPAAISTRQVVVRAPGTGKDITKDSLIRFNFRVSRADTGEIIAKKYEVGTWALLSGFPEFVQSSIAGQKSGVSLRVLLPPSDAQAAVLFCDIPQVYANTPLVYDTYVESREAFDR